MPKAPRTTSDPFGAKLLQVLKDLGHADDLNYLASVFEVRVQSVYDWINHGRMAKERYPQLVKWSKRSLDWWFDAAPDANINPTGVSRFVANEPIGTYASKTPWPFERVSYEFIRSLNKRDVDLIEASIISVVTALGLSQPNTKSA